RRSLRAIAGVGGRTGGRRAGRDRCDRPAGCAGSQGCNRHYSARIHSWRRSGRSWPCFQSQPPRWQSHGRLLSVRCACGEAAGTAARDGAERHRVFLLINPANPASEPQTRDVRAAVGALGLELLFLNASSESDIEAAFASFVERRVDGVIVGSDPLFLSRRDQVVALVARRAIPAVHYLREFAVAGGRLSYGSRLADAFRLAGSYAGRILKGGKPADLPVVQAVKFELVLNLKTAKGARVSGAGQIARGCRRGD